ncbi:MAG: alpha/beta hydrolase [Planctomycetaceae bacterium]
MRDPSLLSHTHRRRRFTVVVMVVVGFSLTIHGSALMAKTMNDEAPAAESPVEPDDQPPVDEPVENAKAGRGVKTLGGMQFWGDVCFFQGWRIQKNVFTEHFRLLDPKDNRHASGTLEECQAKLTQIRAEQKLPAMSGKAVVLLHGIGRSSRSFFGMSSALADDGYLVVGFDYPSTRVSIQDAAEYLHSVLQSLDGIDRIDVVCHSMGGLLLRAYLMKHDEPRFGKAVMLGVPNKGAQVADFLKDNRLFKAVMGPAGQQLVSGPDSIVHALPVPTFPFGVIAGGRSAARGYNPLLPGDNDSTVTVASTRLPGAADYRLVPVIHSFLMNDRRVIQATRTFLQQGCFDPDQPAQPISRDDVTVLE